MQKKPPNFIGNRIGVFSILSVIHHTAAFARFRRVDALTGPAGAEKSTTYHTSDVVGLDTMAHVIKTMATPCPMTRGTASSSRRRGCPR